MISTNSGLREAPPTRKPSTSFCEASSLQVPPVTEPERKNRFMSRDWHRKWNESTQTFILSHRLTSIDDPHRAGYSLRHIALQPLPQFLMNLLSLRSHRKHIMMSYKERITFFIRIIFSCYLYLPAVGKRSCRCQLPKQAHKQARPCSSPLHCLWKRRVIRLESGFRKMSDLHHTLACTNCPWNVCCNI